MAGNNWLFLLTAAAVQAQAPADLTPAEMQLTLRTLQERSGTPEAVSFTALNRLAIEGLLRKHPESVEIVTLPAAAPPSRPLLFSESLNPRIACLRPGAFTTDAAAALRAGLTKLAATSTAAAILDLRTPDADGDPHTAAAMASCFLPRDTLLFSFPDPVKTTGDPVWLKDLIVLTDGDSGNAAEILARVLQLHKRALTAGAATRGRMAAIATLPLRQSDSGVLTLRYTAQPVHFPGGTDTAGVVPDLPVLLPPALKASLFAAQARDGMARTIFQTPPPRAGETALITGINPELPGRIARSAGRAEEEPLTDPALQRAADVLTARLALTPPPP